MALLNILRYPDERLHRTAKPVATIDKTIRELIKNMAETMYAANGIGLAATQVNVQKRVIVIDVSEERNQILSLINPEITAATGTTQYKEGCLSVPDVYDTVTRFEAVQIRALSYSGKSVSFEATGLLAICLQHEIDHLNGTLFIEHLSQLKQSRIRKSCTKKL